MGPLGASSSVCGNSFVLYRWLVGGIYNEDGSRTVSVPSSSYLLSPSSIKAHTHTSVKQNSHRIVGCQTRCDSVVVVVAKEAHHIWSCFLRRAAQPQIFCLHTHAHTQRLHLAFHTIYSRISERLNIQQSASCERLRAFRVALFSTTLSIDCATYRFEVSDTGFRTGPFMFSL